MATHDMPEDHDLDGPLVTALRRLPLRQTFGGQAGNQFSTSVTDVQRLPPTPANVARTLVTIPAGFRQFVGPAGDQ